MRRFERRGFRFRVQGRIYVRFKVYSLGLRASGLGFMFMVKGLVIRV